MQRQRFFPVAMQRRKSAQPLSTYPEDVRICESQSNEDATIGFLRSSERIFLCALPSDEHVLIMHNFIRYNSYRQNHNATLQLRIR